MSGSYGLSRGAGNSSSDDTGGGASTSVHDDQTISLLGRILKELKISNLHNMVLTDNDFQHKDVEN